MRFFFISVAVCCFVIPGYAQLSTGRELKLVIVSDEHKALPRATVRLLRPDSTLVQTQLTDDAGTVYFKELLQGNYSCQVHFTGFKLLQAHGIDLVGNNLVFDTLVMAREVAVLSDVSVTSKKPFVQYFPDKTVINVESSITKNGHGRLYLEHTFQGKQYSPA